MNWRAQHIAYILQHYIANIACPAGPPEGVGIGVWKVGSLSRTLAQMRRRSTVPASWELHRSLYLTLQKEQEVELETPVLTWYVCTPLQLGLRWPKPVGGDLGPHVH